MSAPTAAEIREALQGHWPASEYLMLHEVGQDSMRQGRKIDCLVISLWKSRGHELDAVEIKVSVGDWMKEVNQPSKADFWWEHSHRFWVAVPVKIAPKVLETLPEGWGLLIVDTGQVKVQVKAAKHSATPLSWTCVVGAMRGASGAGANALMRAEARGRERGYKEGRADAERATGDSALKERVEKLRETISAFEEASGIELARCYNGRDAKRLGELVALVDEWDKDPRRLADRLRGQAKELVSAAGRVESIADAFCAPVNAVQ